MRIVHLNAFDQRGGAGITVSRLHRALLSEEVDSHLLVQFQAGASTAVAGPSKRWQKALALLADAIDPLPLRRYPQRTQAVFSCNWVPSFTVSRVREMRPDLIHLHWIHAGMLPARALQRFDRPLIWTLHDMWPFTGGCHQAADCTRYQADCGRCPVLSSSRPADLSHRQIKVKGRAWSDVPIALVAPSEWLANKARQSALFRERTITVIPHGVDRSVYRPWDRDMARQLLGLPDGPLVMFSATKGLRSPQKGVSLVERVMARVRLEVPEATLVVMGSDRPADAMADPSSHFLGYLHDDVTRALAFAAVDALLFPSEGESFGNVVLESLACGTPVVATSTGVSPDLLSDPICGTAIAGGGADALAQSLTSLLVASSDDRASIREHTRGYDLADMAAAYRALYAELGDGQ